MSLIRIAIRTAAVEALKGRTLVGDNVLDSEIGVIDVSADGELNVESTRPFIAVYSEVSLADLNDVNLRSLTQNGNVELVFEAGLTAAMVETDNTGNSVLIGVGFPDTDRAMERQLDLVIRQIFDALSDPDNEWAQIFKGLSLRFIQVRRGRISTTDSGIRRAAQQITLKVDLIADPVKGEPEKADSPFGRFLHHTAMSGNQELQKLAQLMREQLEPQSNANTVDQRRYGHTSEERDALLLP